jgi:hypothetical protein
MAEASFFQGRFSGHAGEAVNDVARLCSVRQRSDIAVLGCADCDLEIQAVAIPWELTGFTFRG